MTKNGTFQFGDHVENIAASDNNPIKRGRFVRIVKRSGRMNAGTFVEYFANGDLHLTPSDNIRSAARPAPTREAKLRAGLERIVRGATSVLLDAVLNDDQINPDVLSEIIKDANAALSGETGKP